MKIRRSTSLDPKECRETGVALIIVLLTLFVLGAMAAMFSYSMKIESRLAINTGNATELEWLGRSGIEYAKWILVQQDRVPSERGFNSLNQFWAGGPGPLESADNPFEGLSLKDIPVGEGRISVRIEDTERLLNINTVARNPVLLDQALVYAGADSTDSTIISSALQDWIDRDDFAHPGNGAESEYYLGLTPPYRAKNGPVDDVRELLLLRGMKPELFWGSQYRITSLGDDGLKEALGMNPNSTKTGQGLVSLFCALSNGKVNINTASQKVIALILGGDESLAGEVVKIRSGPDGMDATEDDQPARNAGEIPRLLGPVGPSAQGLFVVQSMTFSVTVRAELGAARQTFTGLIRRVGPRDYQNLYFRQE